MKLFLGIKINHRKEDKNNIGTTRLPQKDRITVLEYLEHREWGVALEHLCATICEENILISENVVHLIKDTSQQMDIWDEIKEEIKDFI
ncbi:MafI family immunity protein [Lysinibacillus sp. NPDC093692]|uniref:MafI family immunity protein n=1 Tax=Lysinibacillus sp. NPDC093692 TaxID=3390578 RepID=UPI003D0899DD